MTFDGKAFGQELVDATKKYVDKTVTPLLAQIEALKAEIETLKRRPEPKDADPAAVAAIVAGDIRKDLDVLRGAVEALPTKAPELPDIPALIAAAMPPVPTADQVKAMVTETVMALPPAENGKDIDPEVVKAAITEQVEATLAGWPQPQDGKSVSAEELAPLIEDRVQRAVLALPVAKDGKDGLGVIEFLPVTKDGHLLVTMSNGTVRDIGLVQGKDGANGLDGKDGRDGIDGRIGERGLDGAPGLDGKGGLDGTHGKDGAPGQDGRDAEPVTRELIIEAVRSTDAVSVAVQQYLEANPPAAGKDGSDGVDGKDGMPGRDGVDGKDGANGLDGKDGADGLHGKDGTDGLDGQKGDPGDPGERGLLGERGEKGEAGERGEPGLIGKDAELPDLSVLEFAPPELSERIGLAVKKMMEFPRSKIAEVAEKSFPVQPVVNIALTDNREPSVVNVAPPNVHVEMKRGKEVTKVTGYDANGRIASFEKTEEE